MPFYETYFMIHRKVTTEALKSILTDTTKAITRDGGAVFKFRDFGWRHSGYMMRKSGFGQFHYGRWFQLMWGGNPAALDRINDIMRHNTGVSRFMNTKIEKPTDMYSERSSYYQSPDVYAKETSEIKHTKIDSSA
jgi:ribosomal protein S6